MAEMADYYVIAFFRRIGPDIDLEKMIVTAG